MKIARFVLKIVAAAMALVAVVCAVVAFWDKIMDVFYNIADRMEERRADVRFASEYDDYDEDFEL